MKTNYKNKKVLILGLGLNQGGVGAARFFVSQGAQVKVTDLKKAGELNQSLGQLRKFKKITYTLGQHKTEDIDWADLIIRNPAIKPDNQFLKYALERGKQVEMDLGIFLQYVDRNQLIGVTGTKGKSTTASLIYEVLNSSKKKVILAGNIGKSVLDVIPYIKRNTLLVLELSSFQLQAFEQHKFSPKYAVITNIYPDHLNYHGTMSEYVGAKKNIARFQTKADFVFLNADNKYLKNPKFLADLQGKIRLFSAKDVAENISSLAGLHNKENIAAALAVAKEFGINKKTALYFLQSFQGIPFRMQLVYGKNNIRIYNDSASTNPTSTIQALKTFPNCILIVGGVNKNLPYQDLAKAIEKYPKDIYFLEGDATEEIRNYLRFKTFPTFRSFDKILTDIKFRAEKGDVVLFSPGAASFNLFKNEFDRGEKFNKAVKKVFK
jgi:UDP-N-acetylmuramoylalanine--D-glutamate ligase